ncbi:cell division protein FtsX [Sideroxyarcus emersonii]|uniref:Cell division protein FtsX n=1 Tax=Sideroxyarcus emersonii TaxID=2764705 RepID=A0AAN2BZY8_9PROT|nr:permease-like cell division protein FtsX [Sideroxyarcus emersonii]BCK88297.1 cell division protein FtsX [Sideroxyarcus emersonii]
MRTLIEHLHVLRFTLQRLLLTPNASLLNILVIGIALSLPVGGYVLLKSAQSLGTQIAGTPQISVFLAAGTSAGDIERIGDRLRQHAAIKHIEFVPREAALKKLQQSTGLSDVISSLSQNPLPDAFVIYPKDGSVATLEALRDELKTWPRFDHVQLDSAWIHKLAALLDFGRMAVAILAALLSFALIAITFNTIRLQILTRREEIEVAKLIGATDAFIRRPFLYFGLTQGLLGGITAWLLVAGSLMLLNHQIGTLAQLYASNFSLQHLSPGDSLALLGFSAYLGWLGAWFSVSQHLWQIEPR